jgi:two-component system, chemotaxis family, CheB/CheR fusion protein
MTETPFPIVAIGASAGGVEALSALFERLPSRPDAAFVVVTHLAPDHESMLPEILARHTAMPVATAVDGTPIKRAHVYLNAPDAVLKMRDGVLVQDPRDHEHNSIDIFLTSLAIEAKDRAVAAILSGTGSDGAIGVKAVRAAGGFTLAQAGDTTHHSHQGMPDAAVATGFVDCSLPIAELADRLVAYIANYDRGLMRGVGDLSADALEAAKQSLYSTLQQRVGHDFSRYKDKTFLRRVERRMQVLQVADLPAYVEYIKSDPKEATLLFGDLLIGVTNFFRDEDSFGGLADLVVPQLFAGKGGADTIRVWVPGCATGEEAYSIAMLLREALDKISVPPRIQIFATDVDENALSIARAGRYPAGLLETLSAARRARHFTKDGSNFVIAKEIRDICLFSTHSVIRDPPFSQIDLVSCRNLLIYFNLDLQKQVIPLFHYALKPGGFLFLGASENVSQHLELFASLDKKHRIFQRREIGVRPTAFPLFARSGGKKLPFQSPTTHSNATPQDCQRAAEIRVLEAYAPAHVIVNEEWDIIHYSSRTGKYFEAPAGMPSRNLLAIARKGLRMALRSALQEVVETGKAVKRPHIDFDMEGHSQSVDITVEELPAIAKNRQWIVVFADVGSVRNLDDGTGDRVVAADGDGAIAQLERELQQTRERLQVSNEEYETSVEELKSANEELLSVNEELQSSNEELETSREELQSVNEELHTVNSELVAKVDELDRANSDLKNIFNATQIATILLDDTFIIRSFTPAIADVFKLIPGDRGRCLLDIVCLVDNKGMVEDFKTALKTSQSVERNVSRLDGTAHYLMRIVPYHNTDDQIDGGIVTFVDVTALVRAEEHQRLLVAELNHRVKNVLAVVGSMATQMALRCVTVKDFADNFIDRVQGLAKTHDILSSNGWTDVSLTDLLGAELNVFVVNNDRATIRGPAVRVKPRTATTLGIVIHELATNAAKYGALGISGGTLSVDWEFRDRDGARVLELIWRESGGPAVHPPAKTGLGTALIERSLDYELGGRAITQYHPDGIVVTLTIPASPQHISDDGENR